MVIRMQNKTFFKEFFRTIFRSKARFFSIVTIIAIGVGFFAGINATEPDMILSADKYYKEKNLADFRIIAPLGFQADDIEELSHLAEVEKIQEEYWIDVFAASEEGYTSIVRLYSYDEKDFADGHGLNEMTVVSGRLPEKAGEIIVQAGGNIPKEITLGSKVTLLAPPEKEITESLVGDTYTVVGAITSPLYISFERGQTNIGDGSIDFYAYVHEDAFRMEKPNNLYIQTKQSKELTAYTKDYDAHLSSIQASIEKIGEDATAQEIASLQKEINEGKIELEEKKEEVNKELSEAEEALNQAEKEIAEAEEEIAKNERDYLKELEQSRKQLEEGEAELQSGKLAYEEKKHGWEEGFLLHEKNRQELEEIGASLSIASNEIAKAKTQLENGKQQLERAKEELDYSLMTMENLLGLKEQLIINPHMTKDEYMKLVDQNLFFPEEMKVGLLAITSEGFQIPFIFQMIDMKFLPELEAKYEEGNQAYLVGLAEYEANKNELDKRSLEYEKSLLAYEEGLVQLELVKQQLAEGKHALDEAQRELLESEQKLNEGKRALQEGEEKLVQELEKAREELEEGKNELEEGWQTFEREKENAFAEINKAEGELNDAEQLIKSLPDGWIVSNRTGNPGYSGYGDDAKRIGAVAKVFPLFFFLVAALVSLTTMTRMIEEERTQIGTLKALGYTPRLIALKYLLYAFSASLIGSILGLSVGFWLFPTAIMNAYDIMYSIDERLTPFHWDYAWLSTGLAMVTTVVTTYFATRHELRTTPTTLMHPRAPKPGKRIFLEKIKPIWSRLSFSQKVTFRNLFRYKGRFYMTIFGIAGCAGLLVAGFGLSDSINDVMGKQNSEIYLYDGQILLDLNDGGDAFDLEDKIKNNPDIASTLPVYNESVEVIQDETKSGFDATLVVPLSKEEIKKFVAMQDRVSREDVALPSDGVVMTEKLAKLLNTNVGDTFTYRDSNNISYTMEVAAITENYLSHYIYASKEYWENITDQKVAYNAWMFQVKNIQEMDKSAFLESFMQEEIVMAAYFIEDIAKKYEDTMKSLDAVVFIIIISAGALAFVVLYNLTNINLNERIREIATLKVLGFRHKEVDSYMFRENFILIIFGTLLGLVLGNILHHYVIITMEIDTMMFGREVHFSSYIWSILLTIVFSTSVNFFMHFKLKKVNMVESLKSVE